MINPLDINWSAAAATDANSGILGVVLFII